MLCADINEVSPPLCNEGTEKGVVPDDLSRRHSCFPSPMGRGGAVDGDNVSSSDGSSGSDTRPNGRASSFSRPGDIIFADYVADGVNQPAAAADFTPAANAEQQGQDGARMRTALSSSNTPALSSHDGSDVVSANDDGARGMPSDSAPVPPSRTGRGDIPASGADGGRGKAPMAHTETTLISVRAVIRGTGRARGWHAYQHRLICATGRSR